MVKSRRMSVIDRTGKRYGYLTVTARAPNHGSGKTAETNWVCQCDCGTLIIVRGHSLSKGERGKGGTRSCGCLIIETQRDRLTTHGKSRSRAYKIWVMMLQRCTNPKYTGWDYYGGRGIQVCERWKNFEAFYADMGDSAPRMTLDRKDVDGNYCKDNCRWATRREQSNNRRNNTILTFNGEAHTVADWARIVHLSKSALLSRLAKNWPLEKALTTPSRFNINI